MTNEQVNDSDYEAELDDEAMDDAELGSVAGGSFLSTIAKVGNVAGSLFSS